MQQTCYTEGHKTPDFVENRRWYIEESRWICLDLPRWAQVGESDYKDVSPQALDTSEGGSNQSEVLVLE